MELERLDDYQSWRIRCGGQQLIVDPWLVDDIEVGLGGHARGRLLHRQHLSPVALRPSEIRPTDIIVLTSSLPGHAHRPTLRAIDRSVRIAGAAPAIRIARELGFRSTIALAPGQRIVLDGRAAMTGIRPRFPYGLGSLGVLFESLDDGVRVYLQPHLAPERHPALEPSVDVVIATIERFRLGGVPLSMDVDECVDLARRLKARWVLATGTAPGRAAGWLPEHLLRFDGGADAFESLARLHLGEGRGRNLPPGETLSIPPRRRRPAA